MSRQFSDEALLRFEELALQYDQTGILTTEIMINEAIESALAEYAPEDVQPIRIKNMRLYQARKSRLQMAAVKAWFDRAWPGIRQIINKSQYAYLRASYRQLFWRRVVTVDTWTTAGRIMITMTDRSGAFVTLVAAEKGNGTAGWHGINASVSQANEILRIVANAHIDGRLTFRRRWP